ncbi:MAG: VWA domain-containing protein [Terracidiphilus sp.]
MRHLILLSLLAAMTLPAGAAKRVNVAQLEGVLGASIAAHKSDDAIARQIGGMELSERLTEVSLARLKARLASDRHATQALQLLADQSAFLDLPVSELPTTAAPDDAAQQQMLEAARRYVAQTLPRLPNFLATRTINRYDDTPQSQTQGGWGVRTGLHLVDTSSHEISVRDERENQPPTQGSAVWRAQFGLISGGEFGTTLGMILTDTLQGKLAWSHWEQTPTGLSAMFQYSVPRSASHFEVIGSREKMDRVGFGSVTRGSAPSRVGVLPGDPSNTMMVHARPGYHGALWLDPATGTILRITIEADSKDGAPFRQARILVRYGAVQIGDDTFICPIRSVALSMADPDPHALTSDAPTEWLNETLFTGYHRFASTTRILTDTLDAQLRKPEESGEGAQKASLQPNEPVPTIEKPLDQSSPSTAFTAVSSPEAPLPAVAAAAVSTSTVATPPGSAAAVSASAESAPIASIVPHGNEPQAPAPTLQIKVDRVLIPVVVRDKQGHLVTDLKKEDFQIYDNNKLRAASAFTVEERGASQTTAGTGAGADAESNTQGAALADVSQSSNLPQHIVVFLFDDMHLTFDELAYAGKAAVKELDGTLTGSDVAAVVSSSGKVNSGLTRDRGLLQKAIMALQPEGVYRSDINECPTINYYQADLIVNKHDTTATQEALRQVMTVCSPNIPENLAERVVDSAAMRTLNLGSQDVLTTYSAIGEFVRRMATLPGQRTLVLVSSGFLPIEQQARTEESRVLDLAAQSNVTISALDARGLYTTSVTAIEDTRGRSPGLIENYRRSSMKIAEESMGELADGTGGIFFHNSNDLDAGFKSLTTAPETVYILELPLDGVKTDGSTHSLRVKVDRDGLDLQARRSYFISKPEKSKR